MGDDEDGAVDLLVEVLKHLDQVGEGPQVNARLRLVKDGQFCSPGHNHGDLNALEFAAGQGGVHLPVDVVLGAQAHLREVVAGLGHADVLAAGQGDQVPHRQALEAHRLLEGEADALVGPLGDVQPGDVLPIQQDAPGGGGIDAGDDLGQGGLAAPVGAGNGHKPLADFQVDVPQDALVLAVLLYLIADVL